MTLGQTQPLDPPPTRKLIVPSGAGAWWGVDPGSARVAIATVASDGLRGVSMASFPRLEGGERLDAIYRETAHLAAEIASMVPPGVIVVEQPSGAQPNPALSYAVGATMAGLWAGTHAAVVTVSSSTWKKVSTGSGAAYKPKDGKIEKYAVYQWARTVGYTGRSFDEADAYGLAEYARLTYALEQR
jgi:Holliday junction resolvasome RuvABC endonuclease subunit